VETESDIFEQQHFDKVGNGFEDSMLYSKASIDIDSVAIIKLVKTNESNKKNSAKSSNSNLAET